jgi:hypothetical protein
VASEQIHLLQADPIKYSEAALRGWRVLRVTSAMLCDARTLALLSRAFQSPAAADCQP